MTYYYFLSGHGNIKFYAKEDTQVNQITRDKSSPKGNNWHA